MSQSQDRVGQNYRVLDSEQSDKMYRVKEMGQELLDFIDTLGVSPETERAKSRVEEAVMWSVKHITN